MSEEITRTRSQEGVSDSQNGNLDDTAVEKNHGSRVSTDERVRKPYGVYRD